MICCSRFWVITLTHEKERKVMYGGKVNTGVFDEDKNPLESFSRLITKLDIDYNIVNIKNIFDIRNGYLANLVLVKSNRCFVIIDHNVYHDRKFIIESYFGHYKIELHVLVLQVSEEKKEFEWVKEIINFVDCHQIARRDEPIFAIGGGVLTDMVGFAASIYRRGIPHVKIPTTLIGIVDAAIGVKTGINFNHKEKSNRDLLSTFDCNN